MFGLVVLGGISRFWWLRIAGCSCSVICCHVSLVSGLWCLLLLSWGFGVLNLMLPLVLLRLRLVLFGVRAGFGVVLDLACFAGAFGFCGCIRFAFRPSVLWWLCGGGRFGCFRFWYCFDLPVDLGLLGM